MRAACPHHPLNKLFADSDCACDICRPPLFKTFELVFCKIIKKINNRDAM